MLFARKLSWTFLVLQLTTSSFLLAQGAEKPTEVTKKVVTQTEEELA